MRKSGFNLAIVGLLVCSVFLMGTTILPVEEMDSISGTWQNEDYDSIETKFAKIEFDHDNTWSTYNKTASKEPTESGTYTIVKGWREGWATYYKVLRISQDGTEYYDLLRFTELNQYKQMGDVLEIVTSSEDFPKKHDINSRTYSIFYEPKIPFIGKVLLALVAILGLTLYFSIVGHLPGEN